MCSDIALPGRPTVIQFHTKSELFVLSPANKYIIQIPQFAPVSGSMNGICIVRSRYKSDVVGYRLYDC